MAGQGFEKVYNLRGGIRAWNGSKAVGPVEKGMVLLRGDETPAEIIILAYGLEEGLRSFYEATAQRITDSSVIDLLVRLAGVEMNHKARLYGLYVALEAAPRDQSIFETQIVSASMEGGFTTEEFLARSESVLQDVSGVLDTAMMLETQALDLYMRFSRKSADNNSREILHELAEEEKTHLSALGRLLEQRK